MPIPSPSALCLSALLAVPAAAQTLVTAAEPETVLEIARGFGSAELETDSAGDPLVNGRMEGHRYSVYFYGCTDGKDCTTIQFWTYFPGDPAFTLERLNTWNRERRFGEAFIDEEGDVNIALDVNLYGGVSRDNLDDSFDWWRIVLGRADEEFGDPGAPPAAAEPAASPEVPAPAIPTPGATGAPAIPSRKGVVDN